MVDDVFKLVKDARAAKVEGLPTDAELKKIVEQSEKASDEFKRAVG